MLEKKCVFVVQMLKWEQHGISYLAGEITLVLGIVMWVATFPKIRKNVFELFYYTHHLYIIFIVFFMLHTRLYDTFMMLPGFYLFVIDRYLRLLQSQQHVKLVSARVLPSQYVELNFSKSPGIVPSSSLVVLCKVNLIVFERLVILIWCLYLVMCSIRTEVSADKLYVYKCTLCFETTMASIHHLLKQRSGT